MDKPQEETPKPMNNDEEENTNDLSSPNPVEVGKKNKYTIPIEHEKVSYFLTITNLLNNSLLLEIIPSEGAFPYSFRNVYSLEKLHSYDYVFKNSKTIDDCILKIISFIDKRNISMYIDNQKGIAYLMLEFKIIDEERQITLPLVKNNQIQRCTIKYLYVLIINLKEKFNLYKKEKYAQLDLNKKEINNLKIKSKNYLNIIKKLKSNDENNYIDKIKQLTPKITNLENQLNFYKNQFKCELIPNKKIFSFMPEDAEKGFSIEFKIKNIGINLISTKFDKIFIVKDKNNSSNEFSFFNNNKFEYINNFEKLLPNEESESITKKFFIENPIKDKIYKLQIKLVSRLHGVISANTLMIEIIIENEDSEKYVYINKNIRRVSNDSLDYEKKSDYNPEEDEEGEESEETNITEEEIVRIIHLLNKQFFSSCLLEQKYIRKIILANKGNYEKIAKIIEEKCYN